jgi:hypothetical protein
LNLVKIDQWSGIVQDARGRQQFLLWHFCAVPAEHAQNYFRVVNFIQTPIVKAPNLTLIEPQSQRRNKVTGLSIQLTQRNPSGAFTGFIATVVIGFSWGGWVLGGTAEDNATRRVSAALVQVYAPVCVERFQRQANLEAKWAELTKIEIWRRDDYIKESGFATPPGSTLPIKAIADACAEALSKVIAMQKPGAKQQL